MSRTWHNGKGPGYEYWSKRRANRVHVGGCPGSRGRSHWSNHKTWTARYERRTFDLQEELDQYEEDILEDELGEFDEDHWSDWAEFESWDELDRDLSMMEELWDDL